ncbi:MAG: hypothetical protein OEY43_09840 [Gammaproteobacteria bacterium]|nr:hypothetical protein [Gammaproteobacteria bacterium]
MEYLTTDTSITLADVTLIPIACIQLYPGTNDSGYWLSGNKKPWALIICDTNGIHAFNMQSAEIPIAPLVQKLPELNAVLAAYRDNAT